MKRCNKIISILLSIIMTVLSISIIQLNSFAVMPASGTTGECTWTLDSDGVLTISGNGKMADYDLSKSAPWGTSITEVVIENGVTSIGTFAFTDCTSLANVTIGNSVTEIGWCAFSSCTSLASITIPDSVTRIANWAFGGCKSLKSITIPDSVTSIGDYAFKNCRSLTSITISDGVTYIGKEAFYNCISLTSITIPGSVTSIGNSAFENCRSLTSITIHDSVIGISKGAFYNTAYYNNESNWNNRILYIGNHLVEAKTDVIGSVEIRQGTKIIDDSAFDSCILLASVTIPDSVTRIDDNAFHQCYSLKRVYIPDTVTTIGEHAFGYYMDKDLNEEVAFEGFTIIGEPGSAAQAYAEKNGFAFVYPEAIKVSKLPDKVTYCIGDSFDPTGMIVSYVNNDGSEDAINVEFTLTGFDSSVAGKNTITVAYDGMTTTFDVEIKAPEISLSESSLSFDHVDKTATLTATAVPSDSEIVWKSSNESVATVEDGIVTAKGAGTATITATITVNGNEYSSECAVDVKLPTISFPDVRSGDWYYDAVKYNFERGYITGYSNGTFGPANNIQRQDFALILARIAGADLSAYEGQNGGFSDVPTNTYYSAAVAWAKDRGIVTGYSADNFGVGTYITREQISLILCRYLGGEASGDVDTILNAYPDGGNTSAWAKVGVAWAVENGIVGNAGYINPTGNAGRAEVAQIIYNMSNKGMI